MLHSGFDENFLQNLCLYAGYTGSQEKTRLRSYMSYIGPHGKTKRNWNTISTSMFDVELLMSHILFVFANCLFLSRKTLPNARLSFNSSALFMSGVGSSWSIVNSG